MSFESVASNRRCASSAGHRLPEVFGPLFAPIVGGCEPSYSNVVSGPTEPALLIGLGHVGEDSLELHLSPKYADEILALLDEHGIVHDTDAAFSAGPADWIEVVRVLGPAVGSAGGVAGLGAVLSAFVHRHDKKRFVFSRGGQPVEASGYSRKDLRILLEKLPAEQAELDEETRKRMG